MSLPYRADIDGLRAIAVLVVIFYHAGISGFSGGYVGVDVFFVISGFLITSIILKEIHDGTFSIAGFYERRIRRVFPALFLVMFFVLLVGSYLFFPIAFKLLGESITTTTFFSSNILFWSQNGYFEPENFTKPLLHTWSLAVEEQYYIFYPLMLVALHRFSSKRYLPWLLGTGLLSLIACIYGVNVHQRATFYMFPTRAWEFLFGSILSLDVLPKLRTSLLRNLLAFLGLSLFAYATIFFSSSTMFPGSAALVPAVASTLLIYSGMDGESVISRLLSTKLLVSIGLISYSLYLWHWPIISFARFLIFRNLYPYEIIEILFLCFVCSILSYHFIERPFRNDHPIFAERKQLFAFALTVMVVAASIGVVIYLQKGMAYRFPEDKEAGIGADMNADPQFRFYQKNDKNLEGLNEGKLPSLIGNIETEPCFVIWGDSHGITLVGALTNMAEKYGLSGYNMAHGGIRPLLGLDMVTGENFDEAQYNQRIIDFIKARPNIKTVFIGGYWSAMRVLVDVTGELKGKQTYPILLKTGLSRSVNALLKIGKNVVLICDTPTLKEDPNRFLFLAHRFGTTPDYPKFFLQFSNIKNRIKKFYRF